MRALILTLVCIAGAIEPALADDLLNQITGVDQARAVHGVTGQGVAVGIMDRGIDWQHNDFRNADGTTRIAAILDMTDDSGANAPGNPYRVGTLYTRAQINAALAGGPALATRDAVGHGTSTTGICCGNGRDSPNGKYAGIAPRATLIIVKLVSDGAPAHGTEPAEAAYFDASRIPIARRFIIDKAAELGMPVVMLPNIGSTSGPADGTSDWSRQLDATFGPGKQGLVHVMGTGDDGDMPNHAEGTVAAGAHVSLDIQKGSTTSLYVDLWYAGSDRFDITIETPGGAFGPYAAPPNTGFDEQTTPFFQYNHDGSIYYANGKRVVFLRIDGAPGVYKVKLFGATAVSGRFQSSLNPSRYWDAAVAGNRFLSFVVPGYTIADAATAFNNVVTNSFVFRRTWITIDGVTVTIPESEGQLGDLWRGSSVGPTWDGRTGMDVSAPAEHVFTTYAPRSYWATHRSNLLQDGAGKYGVASAVSAANPAVTGIIALMLEKNPRLDAATVKSILQRTARQDAFTGVVPNARWGYGKVDAKAALDEVVATSGRLIASAVAPSARATSVGTPVTAFATILNIGQVNATACAPSLPAGVPASFSYQTTDPATNTLIGSPNTPADIAVGHGQSYVFAITPGQTMSTDIELLFGCANTPAAAIVPGLTTFQLSAATAPGPDLVAIAATPNGLGILDLPGPTGAAAFAAAAVNIGASGAITVTADDGGRGLPVTLAVCQTNPSTGACTNPITPAASATYTSVAGQTAAFTIFATGGGTIGFDPARNRLHLRLKNASGAIRGASSVAVRTVP